MLLFLFTMGFTSCSEDDKQKYYLELSQNSCEVIQGYSISIDLTAHENTTLNVENPELIDAAYIWELDDYKAKIEIKGNNKGESDRIPDAPSCHKTIEREHFRYDEFLSL